MRSHADEAGPSLLCRPCAPSTSKFGFCSRPMPDTVLDQRCPKADETNFSPASITHEKKTCLCRISFYWLFIFLFIWPVPTPADPPLIEPSGSRISSRSHHEKEHPVIWAFPLPLDLRPQFDPPKITDHGSTGEMVSCINCVATQPIMVIHPWIYHQPTYLISTYLIF